MLYNHCTALLSGFQTKLMDLMLAHVIDKFKFQHLQWKAITKSYLYGAKTFVPLDKFYSRWIHCYMDIMYTEPEEANLRCPGHQTLLF